jgi:hypothetical protein
MFLMKSLWPGASITVKEYLGDCCVVGREMGEGQLKGDLILAT